MGLLDIFNKEETKEKRVQIEDGFTVGLDEFLKLYKEELGEIDSNKLKSSTYYSCMNIRCNSIAKLPIKLYVETEKGSEKAINHKLYKLLKNRPNPNMSTHDFLWNTEYQRLEHGNAFWYMDIYRGNIAGLYILDSTKMRILVDDANILNQQSAKTKNKVYYIYAENTEHERIFDTDEICHFKNFACKDNGLKGTSIKEYLLETIEKEQRAAKVVTEKYKTGLINPLLVQYTGDLDEVKSKKIQKKFANLGGTKNAGKVVPIPMEFKINQLETKMADEQFFEMQGLNSRQIANAFGVKSFQLNDLEKSTYTNIEQQNRAFYSDTLQNPLTLYEQEMDYKLLSKKDQLTHFWKFNVDSILRSDLATRYTAYAQAISGGFMTIAEVRDREDLRYEDGTDKLIIGNGASIPLSDLGKQYGIGGEKNENEHSEN